MKEYPLILRVGKKLYRKLYGRWYECYPSGRFIGTACRRRNIIPFRKKTDQKKKKSDMFSDSGK